MCIFRPSALAALMFLSVTAAGCGRGKTVAARTPLESLDRALAPAALVAALRQSGGGHYHATALLRADVIHQAEPDDGARPASPPAVTTTTDLWMDRRGNYRLVESNDQDGGREIVRVGGEVAVALRYGKMIRRPTQDAESARLFAEALGAPWAAWEVVRRQVELEGAGPGVLRFKLGTRLVGLPAGFPPAEGLRKWRDSALVKALDGQATLDAAGAALRAFMCKTSFQAVRDELAIAGDIAVAATFDELGKVADIAMPTSESMHPRQRTVLEERALLGGLGASLEAPAKKISP
jgi:hypothetical protein